MLPAAVVLLAGPLLIVGVILYNYAYANLDEIKKDWVKYRCNPMYMPFASSMNPDVTTYENFQYCTTSTASGIFGRALDPVNMMFSAFVRALKPILGELDSFRGMITGLQNFVASFTEQTFAKLANVFGTFVHLLSKVRDLTSRILGSATYSIVIASTAINLIQSLFSTIRTMLTSIVSIIFGLAIIILFVFPPLLFVMIPIGISLGVSYECFDPQTPIDLADGRTVPLHRIRVGDVLANNARVTATMRFAVQPTTELYLYKNVLVTGKHLVRESRWVYVRDSTLATLYEGVRPSEVICLNTSNHEIRIDGVTFADYEEVDTEAPDYVPLNRTDTLEGGIELCCVRPGMRVGDVRITGVVHLEGEKMQVFTDSPDGRFKVNGGLARDYPDTHDPAEFEEIQERVLSELNRRIDNNEG
uniref:Vint domain-containing protein n=1 Tax=viral metagenome TaxID=1070528 RepID=A0A6C0HKT3_9ZZZZ